MKKALVIILFVLSGCAASGLSPEEQANLTPQAKLFGVESEFKTALVIINQYSNQPFCTKTLVVACADAKAVIELNSIANSVAGFIRIARLSKDPLMGVTLARSGLVQLNSVLLRAGAR